jgi:FlaA1/EpsC-like NDP-sugar epimerase
MFPKYYTIFNYSTIAIVIVFLILILTDVVPRETYIPFLIITVVILIGRIIARVYLNSYLKKNRKGD